MGELLRSWVLGLGGAAVFCAVMTELCPKGQVRTLVKMLCGAVMSLALISPLLKLDTESYSLNLAKYRFEAEAAASEGREAANAWSRTIIEEDCRAYILDKAALLGVDAADVSVTLKWSGEGFWYPVECSMDCGYNSGLAAIIESGLGIAEENQKWRSDEGA